MSDDTSRSEPASDLTGEPFELAGIRVEPDLNRVHRAGRTIQLEPKVMAVLVRLAQSAGGMVSREALLESVWPDTHVIEATLTRCVSELRKALGDDARNPRLVETIRKSGYRLVPAPRSIEGNSRPVALPRPRAGRWLVAAAAALIAALAPASARLPAAPLDRRAPLAAERLTSRPGVEVDPELSDDGRWLTYSWSAEGGAHDVYLVDRTNGHEWSLTRGPHNDRGPTFSRDTERIAFMRYTPECEIRWIEQPAAGWASASASMPSTLAGSCEGNRTADLEFAPDGRRLAFASGQPDLGMGIVLLDAGTQARRRLTDASTTALFDFSPRFSPDGRRISFARMVSDEVVELFVAGADGGDVRQVTFDRRMILGHDWTPDGQALIYASDRSGSFGLWQVSTSDGRQPRWLPLPYEQAIHPAVSASGGLVFVERNVATGLWAAIEDLSATRIAASAARDGSPAFSPDGSRIAFASDRQGGYDVWVTTGDATARRLTTLNARSLRSLAWSNDGLRLAFEARVGEHSDIYWTEVATGHTRRVTEAAADDWVPRWSVDDSGLYFGSERGGEWAVWWVATDGTDARRVVADARMAQPSRDGSLYYSTSVPAGLWRRAADGSSERVVDSLLPVDWANWQLSGDRLYFLDRTESNLRLGMRIGDDGVTRFRDLGVPAWSAPYSTTALTVAPDGRAVFTRADRTEGDVYRLAFQRGAFSSFSPIS